MCDTVNNVARSTSLKQENKEYRATKEMTDTSIEEEGSLAWDLVLITRLTQIVNSK